MIKNIKLYRKLYELSYVEYPKVLSRDLSNSLGYYMGYGFCYINSYLRKTDNRYNEQKYVNNIDEAIEVYQELLRKHNINESLTVYRKINIIDDKIESFIKSLKTGTFRDPAYLSTSLFNNRHCHSFKNEYKIYFTIELTSLNYGAFISAFAKEEKFGKEYEFLIKRDTVFDVINVKQHGKKIFVKLRK